MVLYNTLHLIQHKIEIKYKIKKQLPGCIKPSARYSKLD